MMIPKHEYIRSPKLLKAAREIPCQNCYADDGTIVAAHTNWGGGKGRGIKADDNQIASLCYRCHCQLDQGSTMDKQQRQDLWFVAHRKTVQRLVSLKLWPQDVPVPDLRKYWEREP